MHTWWKPTLKLDFRSFPRLVTWGVVLSSSAGHHRSLCSHSVMDHGGWRETKMCSMLLSWDVH